jgi:hypothetical protein
VLVFTRSLFWLYNRVDKPTRMWLYAFLHVPRSYGLLVVFPVNAIGGATLLAQVVSRWVAYVAYRHGSSGWPGPTFVQLARVVVFARG